MDLEKLEAAGVRTLNQLAALAELLGVAPSALIDGIAPLPSAEDH